jgi:hypothetical protein
MRIILAGCALVAVLAACERRANRAETETGDAYRHSADTMVVNRQVQDTAIVRHDTTITTDTVKQRGGRTVKADTTKK